MITGPATSEMYDELRALVHDYCGDPPRDPLLHDMADNAPAEAALELLCMDATGKLLLTDEQVAHLWLVGLTAGYEPDYLLPDSVLAEARPERRTRPPVPLLFPLRGGGHGAGSSTAGKRRWPWGDDTAIAHVMSVAREPDGAVEQPDGTFRAWGVRDGVDLRVIESKDGGVVTAYPVAGDGVSSNPLDDERAPLVARIQQLIEHAAPDPDTRAALDELVDVGEWDQALLQLRALGHEDEELLRLAGL